MMTRSWTDAFPRKEPPAAPAQSYAPAAPAQSYAPNWFVGEHGGGGGGSWTAEENKRFEDALAEFDVDVPDRWEKVAALIPGKTVGDVMNHYRELVDDVSDIEAGRIPCSVYYGPPSFALEWESSYDADESKNPNCASVKRSGVRVSDHEKKKGVPWTEEEHKLFLLGLKKYGKGDWRNISRNFVLTRTPTQVASHAQKYFIRLNAGSKDKRRSSIHDITTVDLPENYMLPSPSPQMSSITTQSNLATTPTLSNHFSANVDSDQLGEVASGLNSSSQSVQNKFAVAPYIMKLQPQSSQLLNEILLSRTSTSSK